MYQLL